MRMPLSDFYALQAALPAMRFADDANILQRLRMIKSEAEIDKIRTSCAIAGRAFARVPEIAGAGVPLETVFRKFQMLCLEEGADWVGYLAGGMGALGYDDVISPAASTPLKQGDVLMLDTGVVREGYYSDFDRNYTVGPANSIQKDAYQRLLEATELGKLAAKEGNLASDVFHAMLPPLGGKEAAETAGRIGHGLGMNLTEWPSFTAGDDTPLLNGMVITIEPGIPLQGGPGIMVHEDVFVIREGGVEQLSPSAPEMLIEV
jgi:Xaa-Pro aminopeptidase